MPWVGRGVLAIVITASAVAAGTGAHPHRVDHSWPLGSVEHDNLEQVAGAVRSDHQIAHRIVANLFDDERMPDGVIDVFGVDAVLSRRGEEVHTEQSYYETVTRRRGFAGRSRLPPGVVGSAYED